MIAVPMIAFAIPEGCGSPNPVLMTGVFVRKSMLIAPAPRLATEPITITSTATASSAETVAAISTRRFTSLRRPIRSVLKSCEVFGSALIRRGAGLPPGGRRSGR